MFLKYNISNIKREKRLLNISSCDIISQEDKYLLKLTNNTPHNLSIGDIIMFNRKIKEVNNYIEAESLLKCKKILFRSEENLSLGSKITMINQNNTNELYIITVVNVEDGENYIYTCEFDDNSNYPKIYNSYYFENTEKKELLVILNGWKLINEFDVVYVLNETINIENGVEKTYPIGYYWLEDNIVVNITDDIEKILYKYTSFNKRITVLNNNFDKNTFSIICNKYQEFKVNGVLDFNTYGIVSLDGYNNRILKKGEYIVLRKKNYCYKYEKEVDKNDNFKEVTSNPLNSTNYLGFERIIFLGKVYIWASNITEIVCEVITDNIFKYPYDNGLFYYGETIEIEDYSVINEYGKLNDGINFYEYNETLSLKLPISTTCGKGLNDENIINSYFNDKKNELIPNIIDYEKRCFIPYYKSSNGCIFLNKITFNLFFRERTSILTDLGTSDWVTNDGLGWFQYKINDNGDFVKPDKLTNGDLLGNLGFTDDDVYYRKKKLSKTFLRLSFYNSNNPLNQFLLFYSTIFLDTGNLYDNFVRNLSVNNSVSIVNSDIFGNNNLTASFSVYNRFNKEKSSEGFYLYLFPDGLENGQEKTIYMKVEFNHAGYGKTIPLILPNKNNKCLTFLDNNFPKSLVDVNNVDLSEFYRQLYIPITIKYNSDTRDFIYYFNNVNKYENNEIILNLFEPKINPLT